MVSSNQGECFQNQSSILHKEDRYGCDNVQKSSEGSGRRCGPWIVVREYNSQFSCEEAFELVVKAHLEKGEVDLNVQGRR